MTQPAISLALSQLRQIFDDELFIRTARGVKPTSKAMELSGPIHHALDLIVGALEPGNQFDCSKSQRCFNVILNAYGEAVLLPKLMRWLERHSASIRINALPATHPYIEQDLHFGKVDFFLWPRPINKDGVSYQQLDSMEHSCLLRNDHPLTSKEGSKEGGKKSRKGVGKRTRTKLDLKQYANLNHIEYDMPGDYGPGVTKTSMRTHKLQHNQPVCVHSYLMMPNILLNTDYIATVATPLAKYFSERYPLQLLDCPIADSHFPTYAMWPSNMDNDPGNVWLRQFFMNAIKEG